MHDPTVLMRLYHSYQNGARWDTDSTGEEEVRFQEQACGFRSTRNFTDTFARSILIPCGEIITFEK